MSSAFSSNGPVVIGGLGGSATRVYALLLRHAGFYIGDDLNYACDNMWVTLLLKRRHELLEDRSRARLALGLLEKKLARGGRMSAAECGLLWRTAWDVARNGADYRGAGKGVWPLRTAARIALARTPTSGDYVGWGFKEPNTHVFLEALAEYFSDLRYVYVVRHGLDMAFSANVAQLFGWGRHYGVEPPSLDGLTAGARAGGPEVSRAQLDFWLAATERAVATGEALLGERFLLMRYEELFPDPRPQLEELARFLGVEASAFDEDLRSGWIRPSPSVGRYLRNDPGLFEASQLERVAELGFDVCLETNGQSASHGSLESRG